VRLYTLTLQGKQKYRFLAAGDADARDVDLDIQDLKGKTLKADVGTEPEAVVNFTPNVTGKYLVPGAPLCVGEEPPCSLPCRACLRSRQGQESGIRDQRFRVRFRPRCAGRSTGA